MSMFNWFKPACGSFPKRKSKCHNQRFSRTHYKQSSFIMHKDFLWHNHDGAYPGYDHHKGMPVFQDWDTGKILSILNIDSFGLPPIDARRLFTKHFVGFIDHGKYFDGLVFGKAQLYCGKTNVITSTDSFLADLIVPDPELRVGECMTPSIDPETGKFHPFAWEYTDDPSQAPLRVSYPPCRPDPQYCVELGTKDCCHTELGPRPPLPDPPAEPECPK